MHFRKGEACVDVVELGKFVGEVINFFSRKLVKNVFSEFPDFIADAVRAIVLSVNRCQDIWQKKIFSKPKIFQHFMEEIINLGLHI